MPDGIDPGVSALVPGLLELYMHGMIYDPGVGPAISGYGGHPFILREWSRHALVP